MTSEGIMAADVTQGVNPEAHTVCTVSSAPVLENTIQSLYFDPDLYSCHQNQDSKEEASVLTLLKPGCGREGTGPSSSV